MATAKKPKPAGKKIIDVAHPGTAKPSATAKPIIVTNRPILKDPMMVTTDSAQPKASDVPATAPILPPSSKRPKVTTRTSKTIAPLEAPIEAEIAEATKPAASESPAETVLVTTSKTKPKVEAKPET
ncbi:MAG TPA: hypothetical protein VG992_04255, partial [Candidatus Saccharimonadales bacterium]|nr:hypothetical protein [Candidatus Saccharimonadales bacterium]